MIVLHRPVLKNNERQKERPTDQKLNKKKVLSVICTKILINICVFIDL